MPQETLGGRITRFIKRGITPETEPKHNSVSPAPSEEERNRVATEKAMGPRFQVHDASAAQERPSAVRATVQATSKEQMAKKRGSVTNIGKGK